MRCHVAPPSAERRDHQTRDHLEYLTASSGIAMVVTSAKSLANYRSRPAPLNKRIALVAAHLVSTTSQAGSPGGV